MPHTIAGGVGSMPRSNRALYLLLVVLMAGATFMIRTSSRNIRVGGLLVLLFALAAGISGCSSSTLKTASNPNGTPLGSYTYTVTATSGGVTRTQTIAVTVQ
jgi:hypothetical protein